MAKLLEISPTSIQHKLIRIGIAFAVVLGARFIILLLQWIDVLVVNSRRGPLELIYRGNKARARTVHSLVLNGCKYVVYFAALGFVLGELGINYTAYVASLSVLGLAIGIGSQGLVQDMVTGFFIILESQFDIGDMVEISGQTGIVIEFGLRTTTIVNYIGQVVVIPNRNILQVGRYKLNSQLALIDVRLPTAADVDPASAIMLHVGHEINAQFVGVLEKDPEVHHPINRVTGETFLRLNVLFWPGQTWVIEQQLVPRVREALKEKGIDVPADRVVLYYHLHQDQEVATDWRQRLRWLKRSPATKLTPGEPKPAAF